MDRRPPWTTEYQEVFDTMKVEIERLRDALKRIAALARRNKPDPDAIYEAATVALKESK